MQHEKSKWEYSQLQKDYEDVLQRIKECEDYCKQLEDKNHELQLESGKSSGKLTEAVIGLAGTYLSSNPDALSRIPIIGGMFAKGNSRSLLQGTLSGTETTSCNCNDLKVYTGEVTKEDDQKLRRALTAYFPAESLEKVITIITHFFHYHHFIDQAKTGIEQLLNKDKKRQAEQVK